MGHPSSAAAAGTVHCSFNLPLASRLILMNNGTLDRVKALDGLRPAFSAHVRWCEHGAPIECAAAGTVHCSFNLPLASRLILMNNGTLDRVKALDGLRPAFSAHVRWCEHGAPIECAAAGTVHCSLNLPQASRLLLMNNGTLDRVKAFEGLRPAFSGPRTLVRTWGTHRVRRRPVLFIAPLTCGRQVGSSG